MLVFFKNQLIFQNVDLNFGTKTTETLCLLHLQIIYEPLTAIPLTVDEVSASNFGLFFRVFPA